MTEVAAADEPSLGAATRAILALCSGLGLPRDFGFRPLSPKEWSSFERAIEQSSYRDSADIFGEAAASLQAELGLGVEMATRVARLLERASTQSLDLERLFSRGYWVVTLADDSYPVQLRERLGDAAPPLLYGAGSQSILTERCVAVVGSRDVSEHAARSARAIGLAAAEQGWHVVSGAARGVDEIAMTGAIDGGGLALGVPATGIERSTRGKEARAAIADDVLTLVSPYRPDAGFTVGAAMGRNKIVYGFSSAAIVVCSGVTGGTWEGAREALKTKIAPVWVLSDGAQPEGNAALINLGAFPLELDPADDSLDLSALAEPGRTNEQEHSDDEAAQQKLF